MWRDECLLLDMLCAARRAIAHVSGLTIEQYLKSDLYQDATLRALETVGDAASQISERTKLKHPEIPWRKVINFRNRVVHAYFNVDLEVV